MMADTTLRYRSNIVPNLMDRSPLHNRSIATSSSSDLLDCLSTLHQRIWTLLHEMASAKEAREARLLRLLELCQSASPCGEHANGLGGDDTLASADAVWNARFAETRVALCAAAPMLSELEACIHVLVSSGAKDGSTTLPSVAVEREQASQKNNNTHSSRDIRQQTAVYTSHQFDDEEDTAHSLSGRSRSPHCPLRGSLHLFSGALIHPTSFRGKQTPRGPMELMDDSISFLAVESERETPAEDGSSKVTEVALANRGGMGSLAARQTATTASSCHLSETAQLKKEISHTHASNFAIRWDTPTKASNDVENSSKIQDRSLNNCSVAASPAAYLVERKPAASKEERWSHLMPPQPLTMRASAEAVREEAHTIVSNASPPNAKSMAMCSVLYQSASKLEHIPSAAELLQNRRGVRL